jgi:hypothetical protein
MRSLKVMSLLGAVLLLVAGCAKLPEENSAPGAPVLGTGSVTPGNVEILVLVDDPDGDMVTLHFQADNGSGIQDFAWTSFIASGRQESFILNLAPGQWTLTATAKDELEDESAEATLELTVAY